MGCLPPPEYIDKLAARIWARIGGADRVRNRRALPRGRGGDIDEDLSFIESSSRPHKAKTTDKASFDSDDDETTLAAAQTPADQPSWELLTRSTLEDMPPGLRIVRRGENLSLENGKVVPLDAGASRDEIRDRSLTALTPKRPFVVGTAKPIPESAILRRYRAITETEYVEAHARQWWRDLVPRWDDVWTGRLAGPSVRARLRKLYRTTIPDDDLFGRVERRVQQLIEETRQRHGSTFVDSHPALRIPERATRPSERAS
jgi:hypothetical protein